MEEINAWGAYEAGTTQNARPLGRTGVIKRRATLAAAQAPPALALAPSPTGPPTLGLKQASSYSLFFGTDDVATLKKTDKKSPSDVEIEVALPKEEQTKEWKDLRALARRVFQVYFTLEDDSDSTDINSRRNKQQLKKRNMIKQFYGTMPATASLRNLQLPGPVVYGILFIEASFRGIAQVYFQNNPLSGLLILIGMFIQSPRVAVHGIIAIIAGNLAGTLIGFDKSCLSSGLFGYNSFLVGLALATFYNEGYYWPVVIGAIIFACFSSVLFVMLGKILSPYHTPPFTLPFNIATLLFLLAMGEMNNVDMAPVRAPELPTYETETVSNLTVRAFFAGSIRGVGQVFLANDIVAGVLVLVGIMVCSRISAAAAFIGSAVGAGVAALVGCNRDAIENGMFGFNPSLTLTAMLMFYVPSIGSWSVGIIASIITVFIQLALTTSLEPYGLPYMTLPFCLAALAFIVIQGTTTNVISVPLSSMTTPEDHLSRVRRLSSGFELLYGAINSSAYKGRHSNRRTLLRTSQRGGTQRLASALSEYDESVHGEERVGGFFARISSGFRMQTHQPTSCEAKKKHMFKPSFLMSAALENSYGNEQKDAYVRMFNHIDLEGSHEISKPQFKKFLQSIGFTDEVGIDFACEAFQLMDLDQSGDIDVDEWVAFSEISRHMPEIRRLVVKFFDFVDVNGDQSVEISELDSSRIYLGLPPMSDADRESLIAIANEDEELEFEVIVNFVTIFKLKAIVKEYQLNRQRGLSRDVSLHNIIKL